MKSSITLFVALIFMLLPQNAWSCLAAGINPERIPEVLESAVFIGKVKVISQKKLGTGPNAIQETILQPIQSYKGELIDPIKISRPGFFSCNKYDVPEGVIYEEIIFQTNRLSTQLDLLPEGTWAELRKNAKPSDLLNSEEKSCLKRGGVMVAHQGYFVNVVDCHFPTKDSGRECVDSRDCQGVCVSDLAGEGETKFRPILDREKDRHPLYPASPGKCSPWKNMGGCYYPIKKGYVDGQVCKENF